MVIEPTAPELLTVRDFADRANISSQYVYKIINSKLANFVTTVDGKRLINADALKLFADDTNTSNIEVANDNMEKLLDSMQQLIDTLQVENARLVSQLDTKDRQISAINERLHESHAITMKLTDRQQVLLQAAIDEAENTVIEPVKVETRKFKWPWQK